MKMKSDSSDPFTEQELYLLRKLQSAEVVPPSGSWEAVNARLSARSRKKIVLRWAAAFIGILAVASSILMTQKSQLAAVTVPVDSIGLAERSVDTVTDLSSPASNPTLNSNAAVVEKVSNSKRVVLSQPSASIARNLAEHVESTSNQVAEPVEIIAVAPSDEQSDQESDPVEGITDEMLSFQSITYHLPAPTSSTETDRKHTGLLEFISFVKDLKSGEADLRLFRSVRNNLRLGSKNNSEQRLD